MLNIDSKWQLRLGQLSATNLGAAMAEAHISPTFRAAMIDNLQARADGKLSSEERMWLEWCKAIK